jgi:c-di-GMP-binding flagellar brake protein YcgR
MSNKIVNGHPFSFDTSLNGVNVRGEALQASETLNDEDGMLYKIPFPSELFYKQRRDSFRASLSGFFDINIPVQFSSTGADNPLTLKNCNLSDISADGFKLYIPEDKAKFITELTDPVTLQLHFPNSDETLAL